MPPTQTTSANQPKIVITGTGRAGTTFLVQLLTELGQDTGYTGENWRRDYDEHCAAGLEHDITAPEAPRIVKNPGLCETLPGLLARQAVQIEHAIVPVRSLAAAATSRVWIGGQGKTPGGLWGTADASAQSAVLAERFHALIEVLVQHEVPTTFLAFPRFVRDVDYAWQQLGPIFPAVTREQFGAAFGRVARPELVHDFSRGLPGEAGQPGRDYEAKKQWQRMRRRRRRVWTGSAITVGLIACGLVWSYAIT